jgi:hypothetical protein
MKRSMAIRRTTLILDGALYAELKRQAAREGRTLADVVERTLRLGMDIQAEGHRGHVELPSYDLGPYRIDPADRAALAELMRRPV